MSSDHPTSKTDAAEEFRLTSQPADVKLCECGCGQPAPIAKKTDTKHGIVAGQHRRFVQGHQAKLEGAMSRPRSKSVRAIAVEGDKLCACGCGRPAPIARQTDPRRGYVIGQPLTFIRGHQQRLRGRTADGKRICWKCKEAFPETAEFFPKDKRSPTGLISSCIPCNRKECKRRYKDVYAHTNSERRKVDPEYRRKCQDYYYRLKAEMIAAYGGQCSCCGEKEPRFLTLEHIRRDGKEHRKRVGAGALIWKDLKRQGWPKDGYTCLCLNCNISQKDGVPCPHQLARDKAKADGNL